MSYENEKYSHSYLSTDKPYLTIENQPIYTENKFQYKQNRHNQVSTVFR